MIKKVLRINLSVIFLILIVSIPLTFADWSKLTVQRDTNVITYEELEFIRENEPYYYIYYIDNKPYIATNEKAYNIWNFNYIQTNNANYTIIDNGILINNINAGYIVFYIDVEPNQDYYLSFEVISAYNPSLNGRYWGYRDVNASGQWTSINSYKLYNENEVIIRTLEDTKKIRVHFSVNDIDVNLKLFNFWLSKGTEKPEIINRPAETYVIEYTDYTQIGAIIIDSFTTFVEKVENPLDLIKELIKPLKNLLYPDLVDDIINKLKDLLPF